MREQPGVGGDTNASDGEIGSCEDPAVATPVVSSKIADGMAATQELVTHPKDPVTPGQRALHQHPQKHNQLNKQIAEAKKGSRHPPPRCHGRQRMLFHYYNLVEKTSSLKF